MASGQAPAVHGDLVQRAVTSTAPNGSLVADPEGHRELLSGSGADRRCRASVAM